MLNIKYAFIGLAKRKMFTVIAIIQLAVSFIFLYNVIYVSTQINLTQDKVLSVLNKKNIYMLQPAISSDNILQNKNTDFMKFYSYLKNNKSITHCTAYEDHLLLNNFSNYQKFLLTRNYAPVEAGKQYFPIKTLKIDYNYIKTFKYRITKGENLTKRDFDSKINQIPVLLGSSYNKIFKVGDKINYYDYKNGKETLVVKGFIDSGYYYIGMPIQYENIKALDDYILFPLREVTKFDKNNAEDKCDMYNNIAENLMLINDTNKKDTIENIENESNKFFGDIKILSIEDQLAAYKKDFQLEQDIMITIFLIVFIMCTIGIVANMVNSIRNRRKEFGIHLLNGASRFDIHFRIFYEMCIIIILSVLLSVLGIRTLQCMDILKFNISAVIKLLLFSLILAVVILIYPMYTLSKIKLSSLLRSE